MASAATAPDLPWDRVAPVVAGLLGAPVDDGPTDLGGSTRSHVWRVGCGGSSYVVKLHPGDDDSFAREAAALEALDGIGAPRLVAADDALRLLVMDDLGAAGNLADALLGEDRRRAVDRLEAWVDAVARVHRASSPALLERFAQRLRARAARSPLDQHAESVRIAAERLHEHLPGLGLDPEPALDVLAEVPAMLSPARVLSPTDACPDNNLVVGDGLRLIDFEGAEVRHPAWDVAYLRVPWATCWCSWALPGDVAERAVRRYLGAAPGLVTGDDLAVATAAWSVITAGWFLPRALGPRDPDADDDRIPPRRAMIQHRLREAAALEGPAALVGLARELHDRLAEDWGVAELPLGPAWRSSG